MEKMAEIRRSEVRELGAASQDPYVNLAVHIVLQAINDLASSDPVSRMDALLWLVNPDAVELMQFAGVYTHPVTWLTKNKDFVFRFREFVMNKNGDSNNFLLTNPFFNLSREQAKELATRLLAYAEQERERITNVVNKIVVEETEKDLIQNQGDDVN